MSSNSFKTDNLTVIIRNKNEARWIGHAIQSVIDLVIKPEIVVVDNNSSDESLNIVRNFMQDPMLEQNDSRNYTDIKIIDIEDYTPGKSINLGVNNSSRDYILILSAHCVLRQIDLKQLEHKVKNYYGIF